MLRLINYQGDNMNKLEKRTREESIAKVRKSQTARGFIFVLGVFFLLLAAYLYFSPNPNHASWIDVLLASIGLILVFCAKYAKQRTILKLEQLFVGWP